LAAPAAQDVGRVGVAVDLAWDMIALQEKWRASLWTIPSPLTSHRRASGGTLPHAMKVELEKAMNPPEAAQSNLRIFR
jgi:hypothetical protein